MWVLLLLKFKAQSTWDFGALMPWPKTKKTRKLEYFANGGTLTRSTISSKLLKGG
jgi:hypothetical protein